MSAPDKKNDFNSSDDPLSEDMGASVKNTQLSNQARTLKNDRRLLLFILLMLLILTQVIVLFAGGGLINRVPEPEALNEQPVSLADIQQVSADLKKVVEDLDEINSDPDIKDDPIDVEKVVVKPLAVPVAAVVVEQKKVEIKPEKKIVKKKPTVTVKSPTPAVVSRNVEVREAVEVSQASEEQVAVTTEEKKPVYIKYDINGRTLDDDNQDWTCVQDTRNGLMWEVKSSVDDLRNSENLYSWFNPENETLTGVNDGGRCKGGIDCDTHAYIEAMNKQNFCGHDDWRLPTRDEMKGLVRYGEGYNKVKIDTRYFPETLPSWYWTASSNETRPEYAWYILFKNGLPLNDLKENPKHIRLVRNESSS